MQLDLPRRAPALAWSARLPQVRLSHRAVSLAVTFGAGGAAFAVYLTTLAPTVMWYDMGEFVTTSATLGIAHNTGYPLLILLGKAFTFLPVGDTAYRVNLLSAVCTAAAVAVVAAIINDLTDEPAAAVIGALTLAFASTVWANATWATSYGLNLLITAIVTRCMLAWWRDRSPRSLVLAALAFGLGMCNHRLIVLTAPPSMLLLILGWRSLRPSAVSWAIGAFALGLSVYVYLPIRAAQHPMLNWAQPANWHTYWSMFLNGQTPAAYWRFDLADRIDVLWSYPSYDLTWAGLAVAGLGLIACAGRDRAVAAYFAVLVVLDALVVELYSIHNIYNYLTPGYLALCVLLGVGAAWIMGVVRRAHAASVRPWLRAAALAALLGLLPLSLVAKNHTRLDRSADYAAHDFATQTLARLPERAVVLTDTWAASPLWYAQMVEGQRRDILVSPIFSVPGEDVVNFARKQDAAGRPVYVAEGLRTPLDELRQSFAVQPVLTGGIERMLTDVLPRPAYRDDLAMTGTLYRVYDVAPDARAAAVPAGSEQDVAFSQGVTLAGFEADQQTAERGTLARFTYYWRADAPLSADLSSTTLFFDAAGHAASVRGFPDWSQTRQIGEGALTTSAWRVGDLVRESYFVLVPRSIAPGTYQVRVAVFDAHGDPAAAQAASHDLRTVGTITVR
jgi:hypothetical protein